MNNFILKFDIISKNIIVCQASTNFNNNNIDVLIMLSRVINRKILFLFYKKLRDYLWLTQKEKDLNNELKRQNPHKISP